MSSNKLTLAQVNWSNEEVPVSQQFDDVYFNTEDGLQEVEHNFIIPNRLQARFRALPSGKTFRITETGFGSGLNFLRAAELWLQHCSAGAHLHFISFEKYPMRLADLQQAHACLPGERPLLVELAEQLRDQYPLLLPGWHDVYLAESRIRLTLWFGDVLKGLPELDATEGAQVDAWFLDGFAPAKNPDMWQPALFQQMARLSHEQTTFATFTSAGDVRRELAKAGFDVQKGSGFGLKREMCFGRLKQKRPFSLKAPWFSRPQPLLEGRAGKAIVIGAGLAGAAVANKLASHGWSVQVLEAEPEVATQASGNLAGTVHPLITADWNLRSQWYLQGFESTLRAVQPWIKDNAQSDGVSMGDLSGLVEMAMDEKARVRNQEAMRRVGLPEQLAYPVDQAVASSLLGTDVKVGGLFFPQGGWLYPKALIERCLTHPHIELHTQQKIERIEQTQAESQVIWEVASDSDCFQADAVIVATGSLDQKLNQSLGLPIRPVKGQVTHLQPAQQKQPLGKAVTHEGYSVSYAGGAVTGATFEAPDMSHTLSAASHDFNLAMTQKALPQWLQADQVSASRVEGRVAFRPTTPDHLPIIGAVVKQQWLQEAYLSQSHTHAVYRYPEQQYQRGLFVSNGHGPRGLMSVFLAAEIIYADISGQALPQPLSLYHASHPARFQIRAWRSGKK